jgi:hypothetical protein
MEPRNWTPVRIIAEAIFNGRKRISYLARIPGGLETVSTVLEELQNRGLVSAWPANDMVEPTEAFWLWIERVQCDEAMQRSLQQSRLSMAGLEYSSTLPEAEESSPPVPMPMDESITLPEPTGLALPRSRRPGVKRLDPSRMDEKCVRIVDFLRRNGVCVTASQLRG